MKKRVKALRKVEPGLPRADSGQSFGENIAMVYRPVHWME